MRDFNFRDRKYTGGYLGIDIDTEMLAWCRRNFDAERFEFAQSTHASTAYRNDRAEKGAHRIPRPDASVDFVFGTSVLTHVLEASLRNYLDEAARVLRPGRFMAMSCFCVDYPPEAYGGRHTFTRRVGEAHVESLTVPEAAVAY